MQKNITRIITLVAAVALLAHCQSKPSQPTAAEEPSWKSRMHVMSGHLRALLPYVYSNEKFADPSNQEFIRKNLFEFANAVKDLKSYPKSKYPEKDPGLSVALDRMHNDINAAKESFQHQDFSYAQANMKSVTQYCFFCHTRRAKGLKLDMGLSADALNNASQLEKSEFFVATRQFDKAKGVLNKMLQDSEDNRFTFNKERALRKLLLIELRTNEEPSAALKALDNFKFGAETPTYLKSLIESWRIDLQNWKARGDKIPQNLRSLEKLISKADSKKSFSYDEVTSVTYMMASRGLHDLLEKKQTSRDRAKTYYLLGKTYDVLRGVGPWNLNEIYYESCIRKKSHSKLAVQCYEELESSMIIGYSGSGGFFVPYQVRKHLAQLKKLAYPRKSL